MPSGNARARDRPTSRQSWRTSTDCSTNRSQPTGSQIQRGSGEGRATSAVLDISGLDFEALAQRFAKTNAKKVELEQFRAAVRNQVDELVRANRTRADYLAKFEALIESYNAGSRSIDDLFKDLLALSRASFGGTATARSRAAHRGRTHRVRPPDTAGAGPQPRGTRRGEEGRPPPARAGARRARAQLASEGAGAGAGAARHRGRARRGPAARLHAEMYQTKCAVLFEHVFETFGDTGLSGTQATA